MSRSPSRPSARPTTPGGAVGGATTGSGGDGNGGGGGGESAFKLPDLGAVTTASPLLAWLIATGGGILLFLVLMRRSNKDEEDSSGALLMAAGGAATMEAPRPMVDMPPMAPVAAASAKPKQPKPVRKAAAPPPDESKRKKPAGRAPKAPVAPVATIAASSAPAPVTADLDNAPLASAAVVASIKPGPTGKDAPPPRKFDKPAAKDAQRTTVGYRQVRLSDAANDVGSRELARLDRGDEVEIVDSFEGFLQVRTPDGMTGWIPRQTIV